MAALITIHLRGMSRADYDQLKAQVQPKLATAPGFVVHAAVVNDDGVTVTEIWNSREERRRWLDRHFELPPGAQSEVEEVDIYSLVAR